ncbi:MAG TPA: hypothetical protein VGS09_08170 [Actinomycetota bacterium]|jgi:uncharacterized membrane protein (DUF485 family)|nr:hypothetical protein [Actinomycetota bacterium]
MEVAWVAFALFAFSTGWLAERVIPTWRRGLRLSLVPVVLAWAVVMAGLWKVSAAYVVLAFIFSVAFGWSWARTAAMSVLERNQR